MATIKTKIEHANPLKIESARFFIFEDDDILILNEDNLFCVIASFDEDNIGKAYELSELDTSKLFEFKGTITITVS